MTHEHPTNERLAHIREQVALLVARIERDAPAAGDESSAAVTASLARLLLRRIAFTEQALANDQEANAAIRQLEQTYRDSIERIDALHDEVERIPHVHPPDPNAPPPSSGSTIGDAVRDGFMNLG